MIEKAELDFGLDFNAELPDEQDDKFRIIPKKDYVPEWEDEVRRYMSNNISGTLPTNTILYEHEEVPKDLDRLGFQRWALTQIDRCKNGYNGMSGKMYFYFNFCWIQKVGKKIRPQFRVIDNVWFSFVEACQKSNEWGIICVKRRRVGASWKEAADCLHDCLFNTHFMIGMNSKTERDSLLLFNKVKFLYESLPAFLRVPTTKSNTKNFLDFSYVIKDETGNKTTRGNFSSILAVAPTDTAYEGQMLSKWICDEAGKCLSKDTPIRMFDGSIKLVQDIRSGDFILGPDSKKRTVIGTTRGVDTLYSIVPNKGMIWGCNSAHILSLHCVRQIKIKGVSYKRGDIININIEEFIKLPVQKQRHLLQYRIAAEYQEVPHSIAPYLLGLWLGDGFSADTTICSQDKEILEYLRTYAHTEYFTSMPIIRLKKYRNLFISLNLLKNKHIPSEYLIDSRKNRLQLLAGLLDTDGYKDARKNSYEIIQKNERLALAIHELAISLGFGAAIKKKLATMRRKDGSIYSCPVYRIGIYGTTLYEIPCRVARKQCKKVVSLRQKDSTKVGFKINKLEPGEYFGFELDGDSLFCLGDYTVTHNTKNLATLFQYTEDCLMQETRRVGMPIILGTAGDIGAEGKDLEYMWRNANKYKLRKFFFAGWMGLTSDEYGNDDKENGIRWIIYERHRREGLRIEELNTFIQKYPLTVPEAFTVTTSAGVGNIIKIKAQQQELRSTPVKCTNGWFRMDSKGTVSWVPDPKGRCIIYEHPKPSLDSLYIGGVDPADHNDTYDEVSDLGMYIMKRQVGTEPPRIVFEYIDRPPDVTEFYEQALMASLYYNKAKLLVEKNRYGMINYFEKSDYKYLLARTPKGVIKIHGGREMSYGITMTPANKEYLKGLIAKYVEDYYEFIPSYELLEEFSYFGARNTDRAMAFGITLIFMEDYNYPIQASAAAAARLPRFGYKNINGKIVRFTPELKVAQ